MGTANLTHSPKLMVFNTVTNKTNLWFLAPKIVKLIFYIYASAVKKQVDNSFIRFYKMAMRNIYMKIIFSTK